MKKMRELHAASMQRLKKMRVKNGKILPSEPARRIAWYSALPSTRRSLDAFVIEKRRISAEPIMEFPKRRMKIPAMAIILRIEIASEMRSRLTFWSSLKWTSS